MKTQNKEKTIRELLNELPEPYASQAIANSTEERLDTATGLGLSSIGAMMGAFPWGHSKEGLDYWVKVHNELENQNEED